LTVKTIPLRPFFITSQTWLVMKKAQGLAQAAHFFYLAMVGPLA
jgi:hypothetical protein